MQKAYISPDAVISDSLVGNNTKIFKEVSIKRSNIGAMNSIGDQTIILDSVLENNVLLNRRNYVRQSTIGRYSYTGVNTQIRAAQIGRFSSISWNVSIGGKDHSYHNVSNCSLHGFRYLDGESIDETRMYGEGKEDCVIGNDVWIATNVVVLRGVVIGDGAIIGAGSVVTKDIAPYTVNAGVPARLLKLRFDEVIVAELADIQWWNWPSDVLRAYQQLLFSSELDRNTVQDLRSIKKKIECP